MSVSAFNSNYEVIESRAMTCLFTIIRDKATTQAAVRLACCIN
jgi:hypothetical protein